MQIMDYTSLPHFFRKEGSGSSHHIGNVTTDNCFSLDHDFHRLVYNYIQQQAALLEAVSPIKQGSVMGIPVPDPEDANVAKTIKSRFQKFGGLNGLSNSLNGLEVNGHWKLNHNDFESLLILHQNPIVGGWFILTALVESLCTLFTKYISAHLHQLNAGLAR